jgi:hypothetical protein
VKIKFIKKVISIILLLIIFTQITPFIASADIPSGATQIWEKDIRNINWTLGGDYVLMEDIDMNKVFQDGGSWTPISGFKGTFDGRGHIISNLQVNSDAEHIGFFGLLEATNGNHIVIKNVGIEDSQITATSSSGPRAGVLAGRATTHDASGASITIRNSYASNSTVSTTVDNAALGGLLGNAVGVNVTIINCYASVNVDNQGVNGANSGGLIGAIGSAKIENCYAIGTVNTTSNVGGLVGFQLNATVTNSYRLNTQAVTGTTPNTIGTSLTPAEMRDYTNFTNWDFDEVWGYIDGQNNGYPVLLAFRRGDAGVLVAGVTLNRSGIVELGVRQTLTLTATVIPAIAPQNVTWSSSDEDVATVDANGVVTAWKISEISEETNTLATATITAEAANGVTASCEIIVVLLPVNIIAWSNDAQTHGINLTQETMVLPQSYRIGMYRMIPPGRTTGRWIDASRRPLNNRTLASLLNRGGSLQITNVPFDGDFNKSGTEAPRGIISFPRINPRPRPLRYAVNYSLEASTAADSLGQWTVAEVNNSKAHVAPTRVLVGAKPSNGSRLSENEINGGAFVGFSPQDVTHDRNAARANVWLVKENATPPTAGAAGVRAVNYTPAGRARRYVAKPASRAPVFRPADITSAGAENGSMRVGKGWTFTLNGSWEASNSTGEGRTPISAAGTYIFWVAPTDRRPPSLRSEAVRIGPT